MVGEEKVEEKVERTSPGPSTLNSIAKRAQQPSSLYLLQRLRKAHLPAPILMIFYRGIVKRIMSSYIIACPAPPPPGFSSRGGNMVGSPYPPHMSDPQISPRTTEEYAAMQQAQPILQSHGQHLHLRGQQQQGQASNVHGFVPRRGAGEVPQAGGHSGSSSTVYRKESMDYYLSLSSRDRNRRGGGVYGTGFGYPNMDGHIPHQYRHAAGSVSSSGMGSPYPVDYSTSAASGSGNGHRAYSISGHRILSQFGHYPPLNAPTAPAVMYNSPPQSTASNNSGHQENVGQTYPSSNHPPYSPQSHSVHKHASRRTPQHSVVGGYDASLKMQHGPPGHAHSKNPRSSSPAAPYHGSQDMSKSPMHSQNHQTHMNQNFSPISNPSPAPSAVHSPSCSSSSSPLMGVSEGPVSSAMKQNRMGISSRGAQREESSSSLYSQDKVSQDPGRDQPYLQQPAANQQKPRNAVAADQIKANEESGDALESELMESRRDHGEPMEHEKMQQIGGSNTDSKPATYYQANQSQTKTPETQTPSSSSPPPSVPPFVEPSPNTISCPPAASTTSPSTSSPTHSTRSNCVAGSDLSHSDDKKDAGVLGVVGRSGVAVGSRTQDNNSQLQQPYPSLLQEVLQGYHLDRRYGRPEQASSAHHQPKTMSQLHYHTRLPYRMVENMRSHGVGQPVTVGASVHNQMASGKPHIENQGPDHEMGPSLIHPPWDSEVQRPKGEPGISSEKGTTNISPSYTTPMQQSSESSTGTPPKHINLADYSLPHRKPPSLSTPPSAVQQLLLQETESLAANAETVSQTQSQTSSSSGRRSVICDVSPSRRTTPERDRGTSGPSVIQQPFSSTVLNEQGCCKEEVKDKKDPEPEETSKVHLSDLARNLATGEAHHTVLAKDPHKTVHAPVEVNPDLRRHSGYKRNAEPTGNTTYHSQHPLTSDPLTSPSRRKQYPQAVDGSGIPTYGFGDIVDGSKINTTHPSNSPFHALSSSSHIPPSVTDLRIFLFITTLPRTLIKSVRSSPLLSSDIPDPEIGAPFSSAPHREGGCLPYLDEAHSLDDILPFRADDAYSCDSQVLKQSATGSTSGTLRNLPTDFDFGLGATGSGTGSGTGDDDKDDFTLLGPMPPPPPLPRPVQGSPPPSSSALSDIQQFTNTYQQLETRRGEHSAANLLRQKLQEGGMGFDDYGGDFFGATPPHSQSPGRHLLSRAPQHQLGSTRIVSDSKAPENTVPKGYFPSGKKKGRPVGSVNKQKRAQVQIQNATAIPAAPQTPPAAGAAAAAAAAGTPQTTQNTCTAGEAVTAVAPPDQKPCPSEDLPVQTQPVKVDMGSEDNRPDADMKPVKHRQRKGKEENEGTGSRARQFRRRRRLTSKEELDPNTGTGGNAGPSGILQDSRKNVFSPYIHVERKIAEIGAVCTIINSEEEKSKGGGKGGGSTVGGPSNASLSSQIVKKEREIEKIQEKGIAEQTHLVQSGKSLPTSGYVLPGPVISETVHSGRFLCCLCQKWANYKSLGDLYGPFYPADYAAKFPKNQLQVRQILSNSGPTNASSNLSSVTAELATTDTQSLNPPNVKSVDSDCTVSQTTNPTSPSTTIGTASPAAGEDLPCLGVKMNDDATKTPAQNWDLSSEVPPIILKPPDLESELTEKRQQKAEDLQQRPQHRKLTSHPRFKRRHKSSEDLPRTIPINCKASLPFQPPPPSLDSLGPLAQLAQLPLVPLDPEELWVHESCIVWTSGVYLVNGRLYGLQEALDGARETQLLF
ncbi:hypothetical protein NFI96_005342 [Prochilodus magdalenae]|nr:hypothetical protein NFI96_005342 [Prochilodus magdalenae]